MFIMKASFKVA